MKNHTGYDYRQYPPIKSLESYVKFFYYFRSDETGAERILPIGTTEITLSRTNGEANIYVNNPATQSYFVNPNSLSDLVGVCFQPWALNSLFHISQSEITDRKLPLHYILNTPYRQLAMQIKGKTDHFDIIQSIQNYLLDIRRKKEDGLIRDAIGFINQANGAIDIKTLHKRYLISERRFQQIFLSAIGMSAKKYCQLKRFHLTVTGLNSNSNLTELALRSGYYDQSHFIHEFKAFAGISPTGFLNEKKGLSDINTKAYFSS
jgi:AraC-like DNA-binding protein